MGHTVSKPSCLLTADAMATHVHTQAFPLRACSPGVCRPSADKTCAFRIQLKLSVIHSVHKKEEKTSAPSDGQELAWPSLCERDVKSNPACWRTEGRALMLAHPGC